MASVAPVAQKSSRTQGAPNDLESLWMPFTWNRSFKKDPRLIVRAEGMHYFTHDGRSIIDSCAGLWCVNAGHGRIEIAKAIGLAAEETDYIPSFQFAHPAAFEAASRVLNFLPEEFSHVFFSCSGSDAVDTALKMALAYHLARGEGQRTRFVARTRGYHGVSIGGTSISGIGKNRMQFANTIAGVSHIRDTLDLERNAFTRGTPQHGVEFADELEQHIKLYGAHNIAAVIVEPVSGSAGVLLPPVGYLKRLREICTHHGILLIFDEVITGWGRLGAPFATQFFDVIPDIITSAKGLTNGTIPMGATISQSHIYDTVVGWAERTGEMIEFYHGTTYAAHPLATAALLATADIYEREDLFNRVRTVLAPLLEEKLHSLRDEPNVIDVRNLGGLGAVEMSPREGKPGARGYEAMLNCYAEGVMVRVTGDIIAFSPPFIAEECHIEECVEIVRRVIRALD